MTVECFMVRSYGGLCSCYELRCLVRMRSAPMPCQELQCLVRSTDVLCSCKSCKACAITQEATMPLPSHKMTFAFDSKILAKHVADSNRRENHKKRFNDPGNQSE